MKRNGPLAEWLHGPCNNAFWPTERKRIFPNRTAYFVKKMTPKRVQDWGKKVRAESCQHQLQYKQTRRGSKTGMTQHYHGGHGKGMTGKTRQLLNTGPLGITRGKHTRSFTLLQQALLKCLIETELGVVAHNGVCYRLPQARKNKNKN